MRDSPKEPVVRQSKSMDKATESVAADKPRQKDLVIAEMLRRLVRDSESTRERAIAMRWRERSVSAEFYLVHSASTTFTSR